MNTISVLGPWGVQYNSVTETDGLVPQLAIDFPLSLKCQRISSIAQGAGHLPTEENSNAWQVVCDNDILALIEADPKYFIITSEGPDEA